MIVHRLALPDYRHYGCTIAMYELDLAFRRRDPVECICEGFDPGAIMAELMDAPAVRAKAERYGDMLRANEQPLRAWELSRLFLPESLRARGAIAPAGCSASRRRATHTANIHRRRVRTG